MQYWAAFKVYYLASYIAYTIFLQLHLSKLYSITTYLGHWTNIFDFYLLKSVKY